MQNGRVVYVETRVGSLKPEVYRNDSPEAPANEMDIRIVDHNDYTFYAMRGGDNFADPSWAADIARSYAPTAPDTNRTLDMAIARQAATELIQTAPASFKDHVFHLSAFLDKANPLTDPTLVHNQAAIEGKHLTTPEQKAYSARTPTARGPRSMPRSGRDAAGRDHLVLCRVALGHRPLRLLLGRARQQLGGGIQRLQPRQLPGRLEDERGLLLVELEQQRLRRRRPSR